MKAEDALTSIDRTLKVLLRLKLAEHGTEKTQKDMVLLLDSCGCSSSQIAELLGTNVGSVAPVLSREKKKRSGKRARNGRA